MIDVSAGISAITISGDALSGQWRDPLTSKRVPTGAQVKVSFQRRMQLPSHEPVRIVYDLADNGSVREAHGVPRHENTIMMGANVFYLYSLTYWVPPHAVMNFLAAPAHDMPLAMTA